MFLGCEASVTRPTSTNTVGHGAVAVHGGGAVASTTTSDTRLPEKVFAPWPPVGAASSALITRSIGEVECVTASPQEMPAAARTVAAMNGRLLRMIKSW